MPPVFSRRVPAEAEPNAWTLAFERRRAAGARWIDLTQQNPTRVGLTTAGEAERAALADARAARYDPDPRGLPEARAAIAAYYAGRGLAVSHLFRLLSDPGDRVLVPAPGYPLLAPLAALDGVEPVSYPLLEGRGWRPDLAALERALGPGTRAVVVIQPNHPTGSRLDAAELETLDAACAARGVAVISDEVFGDFLWTAEGQPPGPEPSLLGPRRAATFVLQGLSKLCGLPQLKLSWIALAGPAESRRRARAGLEWIADAYLSVGASACARIVRGSRRRWPVAAPGCCPPRAAGRGSCGWPMAPAPRRWRSSCSSATSPSTRGTSTTSTAIGTWS